MSDTTIIGNTLILGSGGGDIDLSGSVYSTIAIDPSATWNIEGTVAELADGQTITGFSPNDTIIIVGLETQDFEINNGQVIFNLFHDPATLDLAGNIQSSQVEINAEFGETIVNLDSAPCFCAGTRIRTPGGDVEVENLCIGDLVDTAFAGPQRIKWIGRRDYEGRFLFGNDLTLPVCLQRNSIADGVPSRDLWVSPDHAICEGGVLVHAWRLVNGISITQAEVMERVSYLHIELEAHHIIFAENCATESFLDMSCRQRFHNAAEYTAQYGEAVEGQQCLPLLQGGFHLHNIQSRLAARAGIAVINHPPGVLRGNVDETGPAKLHGWAQDECAPERPVILGVFLDGQYFAQVLANEFRTDLRAARLGSGCHAFSLSLPPGCNGLLEVRRLSDGASLARIEVAQAA